MELLLYQLLDRLTYMVYLRPLVWIMAILAIPLAILGAVRFSREHRRPGYPVERIRARDGRAYCSFCGSELPRVEQSRCPGCKSTLDR